VHVNVYFLSALGSVVVTVVGALQYIARTRKKLIEEAVNAAVHRVVEELFDPLDKRVTVVETKMDLFWQKLAGDMARVLHHPEPSRIRIDELLEDLMDSTLTPDNTTELAGYLRTIRDWEPGDDAGFTIFPGEQVAAAILLHTLEYVAPKGLE
jgi:hypothetical protein